MIKDKARLSNGMRSYVFAKAPAAKGVCETFGFSADAIAKMLDRVLEEEIWQWREDKVEDTARKLTLDLKLVGIVNRALGGTAETVEKTKETLSNFLGYIKIPGCVYSELSDPWAAAIQALYDISINKWVGYSFDEKVKVLSLLEQHGNDAVENVSSPLAVLKRYIEKKGLGSFSDAEFEDILNSLPKESFTQTESNFKANIRKKIEELGYTKKVRSLQLLWKAATGFETLEAWTQRYTTPATWVIPDLNGTFAVLRAIDKLERVDISRVENAITDLQNVDLEPLTNQARIDECFIVNIASEKYVSLLLPRANELRAKIKSSYKNPSAWPAAIVAIRKIVNDDVLKAIRAEAKSRVAKMTEVELRKKLEKLLESSSEACLIFVDK